MPRYNPDAAIDLLPAGTYEAVVKRATEKLSKTQNEMIELILTCFSPGGVEVDVFDYLVFVDSMAYKVKHFCESAGIPVTGELTVDQCIDRNVRVKLKVDKGGEYPDKNSVADYLVRTPTEKPIPAKPADPDLPF